MSNIPHDDLMAWSFWILLVILFIQGIILYLVARSKMSKKTDEEKEKQRLEKQKEKLEKQKKSELKKKKKNEKTLASLYGGQQ